MKYEQFLNLIFKNCKMIKLTAGFYQLLLISAPTRYRQKLILQNFFNDLAYWGLLSFVASFNSNDEWIEIKVCHYFSKYVKWSSLPRAGANFNCKQSVGGKWSINTFFSQNVSNDLAYYRLLSALTNVLTEIKIHNYSSKMLNDLAYRGLL